MFIAMWLAISLHLTSDALGHGYDLVGYLTAFSAVGLLTTSTLGKWADRRGAEQARLVLALIQPVGLGLLLTAGENWWWLLPPIALLSVVGPLIDITGRMTGLREDPSVRTRLMALYVGMMFMGGGLGSWWGTLAYALGGWSGIVALLMILSASICFLSWQEARGGVN
jgi:predicted MFS family arabinose efflux permease